MKTYTKEQLLAKAVKIGCNKSEAKKSIERNYHLYIEYHSDYSLSKAVRYLVCICY